MGRVTYFTTLNSGGNSIENVLILESIHQLLRQVTKMIQLDHSTIISITNYKHNNYKHNQISITKCNQQSKQPTSISSLGKNPKLVEAPLT